MRITLASLLLLCACGNWSNEDLEYVYALPDKELLKAQLNGMGSAGQGLRRDPLNVGEDSTTGKGAVDGAAAFNGFLDGVLTGLDSIKQIPPTTRLDDARIWGPYPDKEHPGFDTKFEVHKLADGDFTWSIQMRKSGEDFFELAGGHFQPTESLRRGRGGFFFDGKLAREKLGGGKPEDPDRVEFDYDTVANKIVNLRVEKPPFTLDYAYRDNAEKAANLTYVMSGGPDGALGTPEGWKALRVEARWIASGAGIATATVSEGANTGAGWTECWDAAFKVVFSKQNWTGGAEVGLASACVDAPKL